MVCDFKVCTLASSRSAGVSDVPMDLSVHSSKRKHPDNEIVSIQPIAAHSKPCYLAVANPISPYNYSIVHDYCPSTPKRHLADAVATDDAAFSPKREMQYLNRFPSSEPLTPGSVAYTISPQSSPISVTGSRSDETCEEQSVARTIASSISRCGKIFYLHIGQRKSVTLTPR